MNIAVLKSSPHPDGASNALADCFIRGAEQAGNSVRQLDVAHMRIAPCAGCDRGVKAGRCMVRDDMGEVEEALAGADMAVFATPIFFYDMSAQLKLVIDRLYCFSRRLAGKRSLLLTTTQRTDDESLFYLHALYGGLTADFRMKDVGSIMARGCGSSERLEKSLYARAAYRLGRSLA